LHPYMLVDAADERLLSRGMLQYGFLFYSGVDSLPDVSVTSIISKERLMLQQHQLPESPGLSSHTVRSVVKHLSLH
jgi:hypothetical protein